MQVAQQRRVIAVSAMATFGLGFLGAAHREEAPSARFLVGVGFTYTFVSVCADLGAGDLAAGFAILIMIAAVLYEGEDITNLFTERAKGEVKVGEKGKKKNAGKNKRSVNLAGEPLENEFEGVEGSDNAGTGQFRLQRAQRPQRPQRLIRR